MDRNGVTHVYRERPESIASGANTIRLGGDSCPETASMAFIVKFKSSCRSSSASPRTLGTALPA